MHLVFATNNLHKLEEIAAIVPGNYNVKCLKEIGFSGEIPEPYETLEENAIGKARYIYNRHKIICFADDTGLEIDSLDGKPGVYSARYAGENCTPNDNVVKVLDEMQNITNRQACFRTVIAFYDGKNKLTFEGKICGAISSEIKGSNGFGYDPIFIPDGFSKTFAEMTAKDKNTISHRALATKKFINFLKTY